MRPEANQELASFAPQTLCVFPLVFTRTLMVVLLLGTKSLHEILSDRESISNAMQVRTLCSSYVMRLNIVAASGSTSIMQFAFLIKWDSRELRPK